MTRKILFLVNPVAHRAKPRHIQQFCQYLERHNANITLIWTKSEQEAFQIAMQSNPNKYDLLAIAGGDGTITGVANGLYARQKSGQKALPLWIVPLGTANVLARELKIPRNLKKNAHYLLKKAQPHEIWPGLIKRQEEEALFLQMASAGLDAETVANVSYKIKKFLGATAYLIALLKLLRKPLPNIKIHLQHKTHSKKFRASCAIFSRGSLYGGPFRIAKNQHPSQAETHLILFQSKTKITFFLSILGALLPFSFLKKELSLQKIGLDETCHFSGETFLQADGDLKGTLPTTLQRAPSPLTFLY